MKRQRAKPVRIRLHGQDFAQLRAMAKAAVWQEIGGKGMGWRGQTNPLGMKSQDEMNAEGKGRTTWEGMPEWAQGFGMNNAEIRATLEKAIAGKPLGQRQARLIRSLMKAHAEYYGGREGCPF